MKVTIAIVAILAACCGLRAQSIDESRSRFLSSPHGRTGTYAPYRLVVAGLGSAGLETLVVRSINEGVVLRREVAVAGMDNVSILLPVLVNDSARVAVEAGSQLEIKPDLPIRRVEADFSRPYTAVFSADPVYARGLLPSTQDGAVCDYYELGQFFTDWRMLDGYDAIVILNPAEVRLPEGSQRAIAEFCSLGGCALVVGSFRLGEKAVDLPAPADPVVQLHRGVTLQRFGYGPGAIYRVGADDLRGSASAHEVIVEVLRDQLWFGANRAPAGNPVSRVAPVRPPLATPLPPLTATPDALFWGLAGGLLLICGLAPAVGSRITRHVLPVQAAVIVGSLAVAAAGAGQNQPQPALETSILIFAGEGSAQSACVFLQAQQDWREAIEVNMDEPGPRTLYRACPAVPGWKAWVEHRPLAVASPDRANPVQSRGGMVGDVSFRDFSTSAHRGETWFAVDDAWLVDWWLEVSAFRGRGSEIAPLETANLGTSWAGARPIMRGAIRVTQLRVGD